MPTDISSMQNPKIKRLQALQQKSSERRKAHLFVVEGRRELQHCVEAGFQVDSLFVCPELFGDQGLEEFLGQMGLADLSETRCFTVSAYVYGKVAYRGGTEGVIAEMRTRELTLDQFSLSSKPLLVVLESVEKPGNLGAVLRSADAAAADAVVPCVACDSAECIRFLKSRGIAILTAQLQDSKPYYHTDMCRPTAIVMGTESTGLTQQWREAADAHIRIPMLGRLDSLNVSVSAAILLFEAVRQRNEQE